MTVASGALAMGDDDDGAGWGGVEFWGLFGSPQLLGAGYSAGFGMVLTRGNLPTELTSFVGRRSEIAEVRRLLMESRLVTLTGLGGVGKTRLALQVAENLRRAFGSRVWFVDLSELQEPALLDEAVLGALGIQDRSPRAPRSVLIDHLGDRRVLLILDNCEHLFGWIAALVTQLLRNCAGLSVLATSRAPINVSGEQVMRVPTLTMPTGFASASVPTASSDGDAMALFEQRARVAVSDFQITGENRVVVEKICRKLEGLPLSIELAAARLRTMSVDQILAGLSDRFQLLTRGGRNAPNRQQTLKLSIDWSYGLCTSREQWLWTHLTVFAASFDLEGVEGVFEGSAVYDDLVDLVTALVDRSILIAENGDTTVRYRMLETLRDYGRGLLPDEEWTYLQRRHRAWYEQLVLRAKHDWIGPRQVEWTHTLDGELPNVREALEYSLTEHNPAEDARRMASALIDYWIVRGKFNEGRYWLDRTLDPNGGSPMVRIVAVTVDSLLAALQQDVAAGSALADEAHRLADEIPDVSASAFANFAAGMVVIAEGDLPRGIAYLEEAIERFRERADLRRLVPALYWLGCALFTLGDDERAAAVYEQQLALTEPRGEIMWRAMALSDFGSTLWRRGFPTRGIALLEDALRLLRELDNLFGCAWCFEELAWAAVDREPELAAVLLGAADTQFAATGTPMTTFGRLVVYHDTCMRQARKAIGDKAFGAAVELGRTLDLGDAIARVLHEQPQNTPPEPESETITLTTRELEVAEFVARGMTSKAIAEKLMISQRTVDGHVEHIRDKLGFVSRAQIATWVAQRQDNSRPNEDPPTC